MQERRITFIAMALVAILGLVTLFAQTKSVPAADNKIVAEDVKETAKSATDKATETVKEAQKTIEDTAKEMTEATESLLSAPTGLQIDVEKALQDRVIGNADAPVTIIEYASMTCSHCAHFHNDVLPGVKKQLIETGKAKIIFRDFPLDAFALKAAMMARCAPADKYFDLVEVIFKNQEHWTKSEDPIVSLKQYGALTGMDADYIESCINNESLQNAILENVQSGQKKYDIKATPTFIFNEGKEKFNGAQNVEVFAETVEKVTTGK